MLLPRVVLWYYDFMSVASGKFVVRIPPQLHIELKEEANRQGRSLNQICMARLGGGGNASPDGQENAIPSLISRRLIDAILKRWGDGLVGLLLFGSAVRGEATKASDLDLLLVLSPAIRLGRGLYHEWDLLLDTLDSRECRISPQFVVLPASVASAGGLWYEVAIEGVVLWERNLTVSGFLRRVREAIVGGEIRRAMIHGNPYWIKAKEGSYEK
jgi:predicted nucleotidyltransferase